LPQASSDAADATIKKVATYFIVFPLYV